LDDWAQLLASQPGSPFRKKVAILKWIKAIISPFCHASCGAVGFGSDCPAAAAPKSNMVVPNIMIDLMHKDGAPSGSVSDKIK
jgi:hypothetical protein